MNCRYCNYELKFEFIDLGNSPPSNSYLNQEQLNEPELFYPLKIFLCENCFLVQIDEYKKSNEIFNEKYAYFSSYSKSLLEHSKKYVEMVIERFKLRKDSLVIEIASNDGYLLQFFKNNQIPCKGIEPSLKTAAVAKDKGIDVITEYFDTNLAKNLVNENNKADLLIGNNVLAHVPNIRDFVKGLKILLNNNGVITMEFTHLMKIIDDTLFDTIYHEHFSYLSFLTVKSIFNSFDLEIFDVDKIPTQGGSLRIYAKHKENLSIKLSDNVERLINIELSRKMDKLDFYQNFQFKSNKIKHDLMKILIENTEKAKKIIAYGAAAKGNTLLNYCGIRKDLISFVVDISPHKQGKFLPGSHIPVVDESKIREHKPDYILILPWNIKEEIIAQLEYVKEWGCKFVIPIPEVRVI